jgi:hypothetical protein
MRYLESRRPVQDGAQSRKGDMRIHSRDKFKMCAGRHNDHRGEFLTDAGSKRCIGRPVSDGCSERCGDCGREDTMGRGPWNVGNV